MTPTSTHELGGSFEPTPPRVQGHFRVPLRVVTGFPSLPFALSVCIEGELVEYFPAHFPITLQSIQALEAAEVETLWVREGDSAEFVAFTDRAVESVLRHATLTPYEKGSVLHAHAANATQHLLCSMPESAARAARLEAIAEGLCVFLEVHQFSFTRLMRALGRDLDGFQHAARVAMYGLILGRALTHDNLAQLGVSLLLHNARELTPAPKNLEQVLHSASPYVRSLCQMSSHTPTHPTQRALLLSDLPQDVRLVAVVCTFDRMTTAESMPTFEAARSLLHDEARLDPELARTFVGLLAR